MQDILPEGKWKLWSWRSTPKRTRRLVFTRKNDSLDKLSIHTYLLKKHVFALALELWVYESNLHTTLFVAKADTSGYVDRLNTKHLVASMLKKTLTTLPGHKPVRICLSAKAQSEYLFIQSKENPAKHALNDSQLIKWWVSTLNLVFDELENPKGRLHIPGISDHETEGFLPENSNCWKPGDIFSKDNTWAVRCIPRFDDDPKTRFLNDIVATNRAKRVNCKQFWFELADRQECNINARLGFIGVEADRIKTYTPTSIPSFGYKENTKLKQLIMSGNYSTLEAAKESSENLESHLPEGQEIQGKWVPSKTAPVAVVKPKREINMLQGSLVRKKQKN